MTEPLPPIYTPGGTVRYMRDPSGLFLVRCVLCGESRYIVGAGAAHAWGVDHRATVHPNE